MRTAASGVTEDGRRGRAAATRRSLMVAALATFTARGYGGASIAEIVERSRASVGSLYHHYGGKAGLYIALWEEFQEEQECQTAQAVAAARAEGITDPIALFVVGARAYLEGSWARRDVARLFLENDAPAGFDLIRRRRNRKWVRQNTKLLHADAEERADQVRVLVLTTVIAEAGREVAACADAAEAGEITDEICRILAHLSQPPRS
jgi:AcrR family transcriptional regulator